MADFDPKAYLAKTGEFDPKSYLADVRNKQRADFITKRAEKTKGLKAESDEATSVGAYIKAGATGLWDKLKGIGEGVTEVATHPIATFTDPARRRELERGIDDSVTFGYGQKLSDFLTKKIGGQTMGETAEADAEAAPNVRTGGNVLGAFLPGGVKGLAGAAGKVARKAIPAAGVVGGAGRAALGYEMAAPAIAGLSAGSEGHRLEAAGEAATDPANLLLATGVGGVTGGLSSKVNQSRGAQARQFIEDKGGGARVGVTTPGEGGVFEKELAGVPADDRGIGQAARISAEKITRAVKEQHRVETSKPYQAMKAQIDISPEAAQVRDISPIVSNMENAIFDLETAPVARAQLREQLGVLERYRSDPTNPKSPIQVPERQLNGLRRTLMRAAKIGATDAPGEKEAPLRSAAFEAKRMVDEGPYAALNEFYAEGAEKLKTSRRQLGLRAKPSADSNVDTKRVKLSLEREGQNTKTAGGDADLDAFRAAHPELAREADMTELARARADLSFHLAPNHGGLIERTAGAALGPGAALTAAALGHGFAGAAGAAGILGLQNATPIAGRMLYPLTRNATGAGGNALIIAQEESAKRRKQRASTLRDGGH